MKLTEITNRIIDIEDSLIDKISKTNLEVYKFIQDEFINSDVSKNFVFQFVYCNFYTLDMKKVDAKFIQGYFELMQNQKGTVGLDLETLLFNVYKIETGRALKFNYSFTSKLAHTIDNNIPIWDSRIAEVFGLKLSSVKDNGVNGDNFRDRIETLQGVYKKILSENLIKSTLLLFNEKFNEYEISDTKKLDFIFWAAGKHLIQK